MCSWNDEAVRGGAASSRRRWARALLRIALAAVHAQRSAFLRDNHSMPTSQVMIAGRPYEPARQTHTTDLTVNVALSVGWNERARRGAPSSSSVPVCAGAPDRPAAGGEATAIAHGGRQHELTPPRLSPRERPSTPTRPAALRVEARRSNGTFALTGWTWRAAPDGRLLPARVFASLRPPTALIVMTTLVPDRCRHDGARHEARRAASNAAARAPRRRVMLAHARSPMLGSPHVRRLPRDARGVRAGRVVTPRVPQCPRRRRGDRRADAAWAAAASWSRSAPGRRRRSGRSGSSPGDRRRGVHGELQTTRLRR